MSAMDEFSQIIEKTWPKYQVVKKLGRGSFGSVYECRTTDLDFHEAIKVIRIPMDDAEDTMTEYGQTPAEFYRSTMSDAVQEIRTMQSLKSANVVHINDYTVVERPDSQGYYILIRMDLMSSLKNSFAQLEDYTQQAAENIVRMMCENLCEALVVCEQKGILHRDIKPENILLGQDNRFCLGDFGVARKLSGTSTLSSAGTPEFVAPEVSSGAYDCRADLYSLGLVLYKYANHGRAAFMPRYPAKLTAMDKNNAYNRRISGEQLPPPDNCSGHTAAMILKLCAFRPEDRFSSAQEVLDVLHGNAQINPQQVRQAGQGTADAYANAAAARAAAPMQQNPYTAAPVQNAYTAAPVQNAYTAAPMQQNAYTATSRQQNAYTQAPARQNSYTAAPIQQNAYTAAPVQQAAYTASNIRQTDYAEEAEVPKKKHRAAPVVLALMVLLIAGLSLVLVYLLRTPENSDAVLAAKQSAESAASQWSTVENETALDENTAEPTETAEPAATAEPTATAEPAESAEPTAAPSAAAETAAPTQTAGAAQNTTDAAQTDENAAEGTVAAYNLITDGIVKHSYNYSAVKEAKDTNGNRYSGDMIQLVDDGDEESSVVYTLDSLDAYNCISLSVFCGEGTNVNQGFKVSIQVAAVEGAIPYSDVDWETINSVELNAMYPGPQNISADIPAGSNHLRIYVEPTVAEWGKHYYVYITKAELSQK